MNANAGVYSAKKVAAYYTNARDEKKLTTGIDKEVFEHLQTLLPKSLTGVTVLDLGCGDGRWAQYLAEHGAEKVVGLDRSPAMLSLARKRKREECSPIEFVQGDMKAIPIAAKSVDLVLATFSLMYFPPPDLRKVMNEIARVMRPGGKLYIATNLLWFADAVLARKFKNDIIPLELGIGPAKSPTDNAVQPPKAYLTALEKARLVLEQEKLFEPKGISVAPSYAYREHIELAKTIYVAAKPALPKR